MVLYKFTFFLNLFFSAFCSGLDSTVNMVMELRSNCSNSSMTRIDTLLGSYTYLSKMICPVEGAVTGEEETVSSCNWQPCIAPIATFFSTIGLPESQCWYVYCNLMTLCSIAWNVS